MSKKRVPYCNECTECKHTTASYLNYYCNLTETRRQISVDYIPPRSPKWCLKRICNNRKVV